MRAFLLVMCLFVASACQFSGTASELPQAGRYSLALDSHAVMPRGAAPFDVKLKAELVLRAGEQPGWLSGSLVEPTFAASAEQRDDFAKLAAEIARPFAVRFDAGHVAEHRFAPGISAFAVALLRSVTASLQLPLSSADQATLSEWDSTGQYQVRYRVGGQGYAKQKLRYTKLLGVDLTHAQLPEVRASALQLVLRDGSLQHVFGEESIRSPLLSGMFIDVENRVELARLGAVVQPGAALAQVSGKLVPADQPYLDATPRAAFDAARTEGKSLDEVLTVLEADQQSAESLSDSTDGRAVPNEVKEARQKVLSTRLEAFGVLVSLVRLDEHAADKLLTLIRARAKSEGLLMTALVTSGRTHGLIAFARDEQVELSRRQMAVYALLRSDDPSKEACEFLLSLLSNEDFAEHARFGLGTYSRHLRERGETERADQLIAPLYAELDTAVDLRRRVMLLRGLANSASPNNLTAVRADVVSDQRMLREAAIHALAMVPGAEVDAVYAERLRVEPDAALRTLLLSCIAQHRPPSPALTQAIDALLQDDAYNENWPAALKALAAWQRRVPEVRALLVRTAQSHRDAALRAAAQASVKPLVKEPV